MPAGRGNDLARMLQLPTDVAALADLLLAAEPSRVDVIELGDTIVVGNVYCGIDSVSNAMINRSRWLPPLLVYRLAPVRAVAHVAGAALHRHDRRRVDARCRAHMVVVGNSGAYGHGLRIVPSARLDDGRLDVLIVGNGPKRAIASFLREAKHGTHVARPEVSVEAAHEVTIEADRPVPVCGDGEELASLPVSMRIRTAALGLLRP